MRPGDYAPQDKTAMYEPRHAAKRVDGPSGPADWGRMAVGMRLGDVL